LSCSWPFITCWFIGNDWQRILATLKDRQTSLQSEIAAGQQLIQSGDAPAFVSEAVTALVDTVTETTQLASVKYLSLQVMQIHISCFTI